MKVGSLKLETKSMKQMQEEAHMIANRNGFWDTFSLYYDIPEVLNRDVVTKLSLIADEVFEALAEVRKHEFDIEAAESGNYVSQLPPEFGEELADVIIRTLDLAEGLGIDLESHVNQKLEKNKGRPKRHGKNF